MSRLEEKSRIKQLLVDAISLLCRNGMQFESKFCIEALIAITLDERDVVLININETIETPGCCSTDDQSESTRKNTKNTKTRHQSVKREITTYEDNVHTIEDSDPKFNSPANKYYDRNNFPGLNSGSFTNCEDRGVRLNIKYEAIDDDNSYAGQNEVDTNQNNHIPEDTNADECYFVKSETFEGNGDSQRWSSANTDVVYNNVNHNDLINASAPYLYQTVPQRKPRVRERSAINKSNWRTSNSKLGRPRHTSTVLQDQDLTGLTGDIGLRCSYCCLSFTASQSLREHIKAVHFQMKMFPCKFCGEAFKWRSGLRKHRQMFCPFAANTSLEQTDDIS